MPDAPPDRYSPLVPSVFLISKARRMLERSSMLLPPSATRMTMTLCPVVLEYTFEPDGKKLEKDRCLT